MVCSCGAKKQIIFQNEPQKSSSKSVAKLPINHFFIDSLKAIDLSENLSPISTKNDEIYMIASVVTVSHPRKIRSSYTSSLVFDSKQLSNAIVTGLDIPKNHELIVALVERDSNLDKVRLLTKFQANLLKLLEHSELEKFKLQEFLGDDDLLGYHQIDANSLWLYNSDKLVFKGNHLFDKYEYHLSYKINPTD